jgi:hypothetical protein
LLNAALDPHPQPLSRRERGEIKKKLDFAKLRYLKKKFIPK